MAAAVLVAAGVGVGGYRYATALQGQKLAQAQAISAHLATLLDSGNSRALAASEAEFQRLFELDSRGQDAALLWLKNRALHTLIADEPAPGIESALERARAVGVDEQRLVFGRIASALSTGDLPGGAQLVTLWDQRAKGDAVYQLFVGAMFERAGNSKRWSASRPPATLQPDPEAGPADGGATRAAAASAPSRRSPRWSWPAPVWDPVPPSRCCAAWPGPALPRARRRHRPLPSAEALGELPPFVRSTASAVRGRARSPTRDTPSWRRRPSSVPSVLPRSPCSRPGSATRRSTLGKCRSRERRR
jgi:hypothetical protein